MKPDTSFEVKDEPGEVSTLGTEGSSTEES